MTEENSREEVSSEEQPSAGAVIIAELNAKIEELKNKLAWSEKSDKSARVILEREKIQHEYLQQMYNELLEKMM